VHTNELAFSNLVTRELLGSPPDRLRPVRRSGNSSRAAKPTEWFLGQLFNRNCNRAAKPRHFPQTLNFRWPPAQAVTLVPAGLAAGRRFAGLAVQQ
jgi:hypothetical protein